MHVKTVEAQSFQVGVEVCRERSIKDSLQEESSVTRPSGLNTQWAPASRFFFPDLDKERFMENPLSIFAFLKPSLQGNPKPQRYLLTTSPAEGGFNFNIDLILSVEVPPSFPSQGRISHWKAAKEIGVTKRS
ncbi:hypothetical protein TNCV_4165611 [Trichonephila clavipes]|nr:hypothetical protein TNCV_4165611 [Trichonephila clavipes]